MRTSSAEQDLLDTVGLIYDSAVDPNQWPTALQAICGLVDGATGSISVLDPVRREIRFATEWIGDVAPDWPHWRALLNEKYAAMMPFYELLPRLELGETLNTADMAQRTGQANIYENPFFREWALPAGLKDTIGCLVMKTPERFGMFAVHTSTKRDFVTPREMAICEQLVPHVRRAVTIGDLLSIATGTAATLQATLDTLRAAVVVTDANARIIHCNSAGDAMLRSGAPIASQDGQLRAGQQAATRALRHAIRQSEGSLEGMGTSGIDVPLRDPDGKAAIAHVLPLAQGGQHRDWGPRANAAVFIAPVEHPPPAAQALIALYGLTPMEAKVMLEIAGGKRRAEAAAALHIADSTAKTHLDRVFSKTGAGDQAALTRLVASLGSPARTAG